MRKSHIIICRCLYLRSLSIQFVIDFLQLIVYCAIFIPRILQRFDRIDWAKTLFSLKLKLGILIVISRTVSLLHQYSWTSAGKIEFSDRPIKVRASALCLILKIIYLLHADLLLQLSLSQVINLPLKRVCFLLVHKLIFQLIATLRWWSFH